MKNGDERTLAKLPPHFDEPPQSNSTALWIMQSSFGAGNLGEKSRILMWTWTEISNFFGGEVAKVTKFIEQILLLRNAGTDSGENGNKKTLPKKTLINHAIFPFLEKHSKNRLIKVFGGMRQALRNIVQRPKANKIFMKTCLSVFWHLSKYANEILNNIGREI